MSIFLSGLKPEKGQPILELADLYPRQGEWTAAQYLALGLNRPVEFDDGYLDFPPMPTDPHQAILAYLYRMLMAFTEPQDLGTVRFSALPVRLWKRKYREPDLPFMLAAHRDRIRRKYWDGADLVMEIVSGSGKHRVRDLEVKRGEYARAGIPEYWIIDPDQKRISVLRLERDAYTVLEESGPGRTAASALLPGFSVDVDKVLAAK